MLIPHYPDYKPRIMHLRPRGYSNRNFERKQAEGNNQEFLCIIAPLIDKIDQLSSIIEKNFEMMINVTIKHMDTVATVTHLVYLQLTLPTLVQEALF